MFRMPIKQRANWQQMAREYGFHFHTMYGQPYWDESAYYQFNLQQIEQDLENPTEELHQMCLEVVDTVSKDQKWLELFSIPEMFWEPILTSWKMRQPSLYSRFDFVYDGINPAKLLENNADTPTSLYESGFWQWLWLEDRVDSGALPKQSDQFNSLQEKLINQFKVIGDYYDIDFMHFSSCKDSEEDRGTVQYLQDCAKAAGLKDYFVFIEDIGVDEENRFTDDANQVMETCFKLYPWEFMQREEFGEYSIASHEEYSMNWVEPIWKSILSNKALLPMLWTLFPNHPNLLPAFFEHERNQLSNQQFSGQTWVKKPIFSREGANIDIISGDQTVSSSDGPYGEEGFIYQAYHALPKFLDNYTLIGSWLVNDESAGISIREDTSVITQDMSRYLPHMILG